jgi:hypothetical protein
MKGMFGLLNFEHELYIMVLRPKALNLIFSNYYFGIFEQ